MVLILFSELHFLVSSGVPSCDHIIGWEGSACSWRRLTGHHVSHCRFLVDKNFWIWRFSQLSHEWVVTPFSFTVTLYGIFTPLWPKISTKYWPLNWDFTASLDSYYAIELQDCFSPQNGVLCGPNEPYFQNSHRYYVSFQWKASRGSWRV